MIRIGTTPFVRSSTKRTTRTLKRRHNNGYLRARLDSNKVASVGIFAELQDSFETKKDAPVMAQKQWHNLNRLFYRYLIQR